MHWIVGLLHFGLFTRDGGAQQAGSVDPSGSRCPKPFFFATGLNRSATLNAIRHNALRSSSACVEFIPAVNQHKVVINEMSSTGLLDRLALLPHGERVTELGLSGRAMQDAFTVACALSHRRFWEMMVARGISRAVIFESDALYDVTIGGRKPIQAIQSMIADADASDQTWDLINLGRGWGFCELDTELTSNSDSPRLVRSPGQTCTHAYVVTLAGAKKLLTRSLPHFTSVDLLIEMLSRLNLLRVYSSWYILVVLP